jgi:probable rRNA maturation factor
MTTQPHAAPDDSPYAIEIQTDAIDDLEIEGQKPYPIDRGNLAAVAVAALVACGVDEAELTIVIVDDETIRTVNRDYRGVDAPTDVLSFAAQEGDEDLAVPEDLAAELDRYLGDILIALPYSLRQAARFGTTAEAELRLLVVHGVLHLLGYDHGSAEEETEMWSLQEAILAGFGDHGLSHRRYEDEAAGDEAAHG